MEIIQQRIMWGKVTGYDPWPCVILEEDEYEGPSKPVSRKENAVWYPVHFFGEETSAWLEQNYLFDYSRNRDKFVTDKNSQKKLFMKAVSEADEHLRQQRDNNNYRIQIKKIVRLRPRKSNDMVNKNNDTIKTELVSTTKIRNESLSRSKDSAIDPMKKNKVQTSRTRKSDMKVGIGRVGIIGLDYMGAEMTTNLLKAGFRVSIYDESYNKCLQLKNKLNDFKNLTTLISPYGVIVESDIIMFCLSNERKMREVFRMNLELITKEEHVLKGKGVLNMTSVDPNYSAELAEMIKNVKGKYLEVYFQGDQTDGSNGNLVLFVAGHLEFFNHCQPLMAAISQYVVYIGPAGYASKINLSMQMMKSTQLAIIIEQISLLKSFGIPTENFNKILLFCGLSNDYINKKITKTLDQSYTTVEEPIDYLQKNMKVGLEIAQNELYPLPLVQSANEIFKKCQRYDYGSHDPSAIILWYQKEW